jgi:hypothetical protein
MSKPSLGARIRYRLRRNRSVIRHVDRRLGGVADRPPLHERFDRLEHYGSHLAEQNDKTVRELHALGSRLEAFFATTLSNDRLRLDEGIDAIAEQLVRLDASGAAQYEHARGLWTSDRDCEAATMAFAYAALADLDSWARVLVTGRGGAPIALGLAALGHEVALAGYAGEPEPLHPQLRSVATLELATDQSAPRYAGAVALIEARASGSTRRTMLSRLSNSLEPGGVLVLRVPIGSDPFLADGPDGLPEGVTLSRHQAIWRTASGAWIRGEPDEPRGDAGFALLVAVRDG